jgi:DNA-binding NarL/FixJ family response regulator
MPEGRPGERDVPRVLLCDDAVAFSLLFAKWMDSCGLEMVGKADSAEDAVSMATELSPDVIVIDHLLRDVTSEGLAPCLRDVAPNAKLLLISGMPDDELALAARAAGADAHLSKAASAEAMCGAVRALLPERDLTT